MNDQNTLQECLFTLDRLIKAQGEEETLLGIEALILQALLFRRREEWDSAVSSLARALGTAQSEGIIQPFADELPEIEELLSRTLPRIKNPMFIRAILECGSSPDEAGLGSEGNLLLVEPLSAREIEILGLINDGLTNQAAADKLFIALSTVKKHLNNIYGKLAAKSRTDALRRARELGLLQ